MKARPGVCGLKSRTSLHRKIAFLLEPNSLAFTFFSVLEPVPSSRFNEGGCTLAR